MQSQIKGKARCFSNTGHLRSFLQTFPSPKKKAGHSDFSLLSICYHKKSPSYSQIRTSVWQAQPLDTSFSDYICCFIPSAYSTELEPPFLTALPWIKATQILLMKGQACYFLIPLPPKTSYNAFSCLTQLLAHSRSGSLEECFHLSFRTLCRNHTPPSKPLGRLLFQFKTMFSQTENYHRL